jgi:hypothetical protein
MAERGDRNRLDRSVRPPVSSVSADSKLRLESAVSARTCSSICFSPRNLSGEAMFCLTLIEG